jgi:hypothetical protein
MPLRSSREIKEIGIGMIKKIQTPLQNNLVSHEEGEKEEPDLEIPCLGDNSSSPHLTQSAYE